MTPATMSPVRVRQRARRTMNAATSPIWISVTLPVRTSEKRPCEVTTTIAVAPSVTSHDRPTARAIATTAASRTRRLIACQAVESMS